MKIGILTFWWSNDNYGQILQLYALQCFLRKMGHDVYAIRYDYRKDIKATPIYLKLLKSLNPSFLIKYLKKRKQLKVISAEQKKFNRHFDDFRDKYINFSNTYYYSFNELKNNPPVADVYIVGSDQVWNYRKLKLQRYINPIHAYFLDFGTVQKKIAYAASWGKTKISMEYIREIKPLLSKFDFLGVREKSGINVCSTCGRDDAEWVCDPTLLIEAEDYRHIYSKEIIRKQDKKFLLLYLLNNRFDFNIQTIYDFAKSEELEVVYITGNSKVDSYVKFYATIPEWLYLIDNATYVITNSFHCTVFCTIFGKKFGVIPLNSYDKEMNDRFDSLFQLRGIGKQYITESDFSILNKDYVPKQIQVSQNFKKILNDL